MPPQRRLILDNMQWFGRLTFDNHTLFERLVKLQFHRAPENKFVTNSLQSVTIEIDLVSSASSGMTLMVACRISSHAISRHDGVENGGLEQRKQNECVGPGNMEEPPLHPPSLKTSSERFNACEQDDLHEVETWGKS